MRQTYRLSEGRAAAISQAAGLEPEEVRRWCLDEMAELDQEDAVAHQRWLDQSSVDEIARWLIRRKRGCEQWLSARARCSFISWAGDLDGEDDEECGESDTGVVHSSSRAPCRRGSKPAGHRVLRSY